jgi:hypothetical protein
VRAFVIAALFSNSNSLRYLYNLKACLYDLKAGLKNFKTAFSDNKGLLWGIPPTSVAALSVVDFVWYSKQPLALGSRWRENS